MKSTLACGTVLALLACGCITTQQAQRASYWQIQARNLRTAYESGQITANEYFARSNELQMLAQQDKARQQQATLSALGIFQQQNQFRQQQRSQQQMQMLQNMQRSVNSRPIRPPLLPTPSTPSKPAEWRLQNNYMKGTWQYAPEGSSPKYNWMEDEWQLAP